MCIQYWPSVKVNSENYGDLNISVLHEEELANFHIRTIQVVKKQGTVSENPQINIIIYLITITRISMQSIFFFSIIRTMTFQSHSLLHSCNGYYENQNFYFHFFDSYAFLDRLSA